MSFLIRSHSKPYEFIVIQTDVIVSQRNLQRRLSNQIAQWHGIGVRVPEPEKGIDRDALGRYQIAHQRYQRITNNVLPNAQESYQLSQTAFNAGETNYLQLLTAQRTLFNTRLSVLDSAAQAKRAIAEIEGLLVTIRD